MLAEGESRLHELEELPGLVEEYLKDLPYLVDRMPIIREYETIGAERTPENPLGLYTLTPDRIRYLSGEEVAARRRGAEAARGARFREPYAMLGLRVAVHADGTLEITLGATDTKGGVMPCDGSGSSSVAGHNAGQPLRALGLVVRARLGAEGGERWSFETVGRVAR